MNEKLNKKTYENIIELVLYKRDRNPKKDWGHIQGWTTIFSYCKNNVNSKDLEKYEKYLEKDYSGEDVFINMLNKWYNGSFERKYLDEYKEYFDKNYLYNFIYGISQEKTFKHDYYFRFSESIDLLGLKFLLNSYKHNSDYLFSSIALGSYYQHNQKLDLAYKFYLNGLIVDKNNPYILAKLAVLYSSRGGEEGLLKAEKTMQKVINLLPKIPWVNAWYGETLNMIGKYYDALKYFEKYENLTKNKHRTFEPFMRKAESYIGLGDFRKARLELDRESLYYFGEGYRFVYNDLDKQLKSLGY